jgi:anti-anti-sigma factor
VTAGANDDDRIALLATAGEDGGSAAVLTELGGDPGSSTVHVFIIGALRPPDCAAVGSGLLDLAATAYRVTVDLSEVTLLSAAGFGLLVQMCQVVAANGGELVINAVSPAAAAVLDVLKWTEVTQVITEMSVR